LIFVPLTNLALADLPMDRIPNGTGLFNLLRQLGGSIGIAISATLLSRFAATNHALLAEHVSSFDPFTRTRLAAIASALVARGELPAPADRHALAILDRPVTRQAMMLSFERLFLLFGLGFVLATPLLLLMRKGRGFQGGAAAH